MHEKDTASPSHGSRDSLLSSDPRAVEVPPGLADEGERYGDIESLAHDRSGETVRCTDGRIRRPVVMKILAPSSDAKTRRRFLREVRIQGQLEHPAIVPVYDLGITRDGREFFTMQTVSGKGLDVVLAGLRNGEQPYVQRFSRDRLMDVFEQLCLAMEFIHGRGVVHRNLTPEKVLLGDFGEVYVTDWSVARVDDDGSPIDADVGDATLRGKPTGTPGYAAPEQLAAEPVDRRADVYSLGAILFEMLTYAPLHAGETPGARFQSTLTGADARASVRARSRNIPPALDAVCVKATAASPEDRYATARELFEAAGRVQNTNRDFESRHRLAQEHAQRAESATVHALLGTFESEEQRKLALQEAGRALALDPKSEGARRAVATLLREPPEEMPEEAREAFEGEQAAEIAVFARYGIVAYAVFAAAAVLVMFGGVASWTGMLLIFTPLLVTIYLCHRLLSEEHHQSELVFVIFLTSTLAISAASGLYGALVLVPQLVVANTLALNVTSLKQYRLPMLGAGLLAVSVPLALERFGVLPRAYQFSEAAVVIFPVVREFPETPVRVGMLLSALAAVIAPCLYVWKAHDSLTALGDALEQQAWRIRQLLPADAEALLDSPSRGKKRGRWR